MSLLQEQTSFQQGNWKKATIAKDLPRILHASVVIDQYLVVIGGTGKQRQSSKDIANVVVFDLQKETSTQLEISGREAGPLYGHSACYWKDNRVIVYGGQGASNVDVRSDIGVINLSFTEPMKAEWETIKTDSNFNRMGHTAHVYNNQMIVIGGIRGYIGPVEGIHILNLDNFKWTQPQSFGTPPKGSFTFHSSTMCENKLFVFREKVGDDNEYGLFSLNLESYSWHKFSLWSSGDGYNFASIREHKGKIYVVEHVSSQAKVVARCFDPTHEKWSSAPPLEYQLTGFYFTLNVYDNQLVLFGGADNQFTVNSSNELWFFRLGDSERPKSIEIKDQVQHCLKAFLTEAPYSDIIFEVESELIPAHKWWLCKKSKYFANMFSSGMMEAKSSRILISDMSAATFRGFLEYLYRDDIELDFTLARELLTQADKYSVPELKGLCEQFLIGNIAPDNFVSLANLSELLEANKLRDAVKDYIAKNIKLLKSRKDFEELSIDMLRDVVVKVTAR